MLIVDFRVATDADWDDSFWVTDTTNKPVSLADADLELTVKLDDPVAPDDGLILFATTGNGMIVKDEEHDNVFSIAVPYNTVKDFPLGRHFHVLHIIRPGERKRFWFGAIEFTEPFK